MITASVRVTFLREIMRAVSLLNVNVCPITWTEDWDLPVAI